MARRYIPTNGKWNYTMARLSVNNAIRTLEEYRQRSEAVANSLQWRHNGRGSVSHLPPYDCLLNCLFRRTSKKASKLRVTGICVGNSPGTGEFPAQMSSNAENVSIWWRHHVVVWQEYQKWAFRAGTINYSCVYHTDTVGCNSCHCLDTRSWHLSPIYDSDIFTDNANTGNQN